MSFGKSIVKTSANAGTREEALYARRRITQPNSPCHTRPLPLHTEPANFQGRATPCIPIATSIKGRGSTYLTTMFLGLRSSVSGIRSLRSSTLGYPATIVSTAAFVWGGGGGHVCTKRVSACSQTDKKVTCHQQRKHGVVAHYRVLHRSIVRVNVSVRVHRNEWYRGHSSRCREPAHSQPRGVRGIKLFSEERHKRPTKGKENVRRKQNATSTSDSYLSA